jgi:hypothetical protein
VADELTEGAMPTLEYYRMLLDELGPTVKDFEREVYMRGLSRAIDAEPTRGMCGELAGVTILTYVMAGRVLVTLWRGGEQVSVMAAEGEDPPRMGLHTTTDVEAARSMLRAVIAGWPQDGAAQDRVLSANTRVGIG